MQQLHEADVQPSKRPVCQRFLSQLLALRLASVVAVTRRRLDPLRRCSVLIMFLLALVARRSCRVH